MFEMKRMKAAFGSHGLGAAVCCALLACSSCDKPSSTYSEPRDIPMIGTSLVDLSPLGNVAFRRTRSSPGVLEYIVAGEITETNAHKFCRAHGGILDDVAVRKDLSPLIEAVQWSGLKPSFGSRGYMLAICEKAMSDRAFFYYDRHLQRFLLQIHDFQNYERESASH